MKTYSFANILISYKRTLTLLKLKLVNKKPLLSFLLAAGLLLLAISLYAPQFSIFNLVFYIFQDRDFSRAQELIKGNFIFFGPELTGGGNLPGPFYYFLLALPISIGQGWVGVWYWMLLLIATGGVVGWYYFKNKFNPLTGFLWLILYSLIVPIYYLINAFFNPSFSVLFIVLINIFSLVSFSDSSEKKRNQAFILACLLVGLSIQIHYSNIVYLFSLIALKVFSRKLILPSPQNKSFYKGLGLFLLTLSPYFFWLLFRTFGFYFGQPLPFAGAAAAALPSLLAHFSPFFSQISISEFLLLSLKKIFLVIPLGFLMLLFFFNADKKKDSFYRKILGVLLLFSFIPFSFYFFVPQGSRYGVPFAISMVFLTITTYGEFCLTKKTWPLLIKAGFPAFTAVCTLIYLFFLSQKILTSNKFILFYICILSLYFFYKRKVSALALNGFVLIAALALAQFSTQAFFFKNIHAEGNVPVYWQWKLIWNKISAETDWSYSEAFEKIYFINHQREQSEKRSYQHFIRGKRAITTKLSSPPDGYFVSIDKPPGQNTKEWLLKQPIQDEIKRALASGDIIIGANDPHAPVLIAPYYVLNKKDLPAHFHDSGWGYENLPEEDVFSTIKSPEGAKVLASGQLLFKWNECPEHDKYCDTGVLVDISAHSKKALKINVKVIGLSLSQSSRWISPTWTQSWINPYIKIQCGGVNSKFIIASSIGYNRKYVGTDLHFKFPMVNNSFLAPFQRTFDVKCDANITEVTIGRDASVIEQDPKPKILTATPVILKL